MVATTIKIQSGTATTLRKLGEKGMTYDEIINEIVSAYLAFVDKLYQRANEPVVGRPLREIMDELESDTSSRRRR